MRDTPSTCEACRQAPVQSIVTDDDSEQPYRLCKRCEQRLRLLSLRPLEWFNLASIHGPGKYHLHDDFYYDNGVAGQPNEEVVEPESYPAPTLVQIEDDLERLIDYAMTCPLSDPEKEVLDCLSHHDRGAVLAALQRRVEGTRNIEIEATTYVICARVLGPVAADWIRSRWSHYSPYPRVFLPLAEASACCLPFGEAFRRVSKALEGKSAKDLMSDCFALAYFRSPKTLEWIETHKALAHTEHWGRLAALSRFSWPKAVQWLEQGPPLSRVALAAICECHEYKTPLTRRYKPVLESTAPADEMRAVLDAYLLRDPIPAVQDRVQRVKEW
jgi:hypothetical protein